MTEQQMRMWVMNAYPNSRTWPARVARMTDAQIYAIYRRLAIRNREGENGSVNMR